MESYSFIESAIVFGVKTPLDLEKFRFVPGDFSVHGEAFRFVLDCLDGYNSFPENGLLKEKFSSLSEESVGVDLNYSVAAFKKQLLYRKSVSLIKDNQFLLKEDPQEGINKILVGLDQLAVRFEDDVVVYDEGSLRRLMAYKQRGTERTNKLKIMLHIP